MATSPPPLLYGVLQDGPLKQLLRQGRECHLGVSRSAASLSAGFGVRLGNHHGNRFSENENENENSGSWGHHRTSISFLFCLSLSLFLSVKPRGYGHLPSPTPSMSQRGLFNKTHLLSLIIKPTFLSRCLINQPAHKHHHQGLFTRVSFLSLCSFCI